MLRVRELLRPANLGLLLLLLATVALVLLALTRSSTPPAGDDALALPSPAASPSPSPSPSLSAAPRTVVVVGDELGAGTGAEPGAGFVDLLAAERGWVLTNDSRPGTGYATPDAATAFPARAALAVAAQPDVLVLQGSAADTDPAAAAAAALELITAVRAGAPQTRIVLLATSPATADALRTVAREASVHFLTPNVPVEPATAEVHAALAADLLDDVVLLKI